MSTSNSTNYTMTANELITSSFEMIGVAKAGEPLEPEDEASAMRTLNPMLKAVQQKLNIWKRETKLITLVSGQTIYTLGQKSTGTVTNVAESSTIVDSSADFNKDNIVIGDVAKQSSTGSTATVTAVNSSISLGLSDHIFTFANEPYDITSSNISMPRPMNILECNRVNTSNNSIPLDKLTRNEYENLSNKSTPGAPISYHYDPKLDSGYLYIWQTPDASAAAEWTIRLVYHSPIEDIRLSTDNVDIPSESLEAIVIGLAYRLSWKFGGLTSMERASLKQDMNDAIDLAEGYEQYQDGDVFASPEIRDN